MTLVERLRVNTEICKVGKAVLEDYGNFIDTTDFMKLKNFQFFLQRNHKGQDCPVKPITCQGGYCSECAIWLKL